MYVILLSSDCFKVQGHLVPRLNTLWTLGSAMREVVNFKGNLKAGVCLLNVL